MQNSKVTHLHPKELTWEELVNNTSRENINFKVKHGRVVLTGVVHSLSGKRKMEHLVQNIRGVKSIDNLLQVLPSIREDLSDREIELSIRLMLGELSPPGKSFIAGNTEKEDPGYPYWKIFE